MECRPVIIRPRRVDLLAMEKTAVKKGGNSIPVTFLARDPRAKFWTADETSAWIRFDEAGKVIEIWSSSPGASVGQSFLAKLRRWLGME